MSNFTAYIVDLFYVNNVTDFVNEHLEIENFERIREGNFEAFRLLFEQYYPRLCNYASSYLQDDFINEDTVQEVFAKIWEDRRKIRISGSVKSYLYTSVKNACLNRIKSESIRLGHTSTYSKSASEIVFDDEIEQEEFRHYLSQCIEKLPPRCKDVFIQSRFDDARQEEIAREMEISVKTVKAQITKALKFIRDCLRTAYPEYL